MRGALAYSRLPTPDDLRKAIRETRRLIKGDKPFGVNITILPAIVPPDYAGYARAAIEEGVKIFETAGSNPAPLVRYLKAQGAIVIHKCTTVRHAKSAGKMGVDILSIDGFECAGHPGEEDIGGIVLLARAAQELEVPYIASGGFADGRGLAAALALGAQGINCGTCFMATVEAPIHPNIKKIMVESTEHDTIHIFRTLKNTARVYKNAVSIEVVRLERRPEGADFNKDLKHLVSGIRGKKVYETGDVDAGIWSAGIAVGLIKDIPTCEELLRRIEQEAEETIDGLAQMKSSGVKAKL